MAYSALTDLISSMEGVPTTNQWDVICSYNVKQINAFLQHLYNAGALVNTVKLSTERQDPLSGADFVIEYDINFGQPALQFVNGRSGFAMLTMPIEDGSTYSVTPKGATQPSKVQPIDAGVYSIKATVPLAAINGDTKEVVESGQVIEFSNDKTHEHSVIIHFKNEKGTTYEIVPTPDPKDMDPLVTYFLPVLKDYFTTQVNEIEYALASVNNSTPYSGPTLLTPKAFVFSSTGDDSDGVLSLYIQTVESGSQAGNPSPSFQPGDKATFPIPDGYTASLILSNSLITQSFLQPQLTNNGFTVAFQPISDGIVAQLTKNASVIADGDSGRFIFSGYSYDGLNISLMDFPVQFRVQNGQLSLQWNGNTTSEWSEWVAGSGGGTWGKVDVSISLQKGNSLTLSDDDVITSSVEIGRSDFQVKIDSHSCSFWETVNHCSENYPAYYSENMDLSIPSINISLSGLNFFCTTNIVAPGQNVINFDRSHGVLTPHDFLMVGQVVSETELRNLRLNRAEQHENVEV